MTGCRYRRSISQRCSQVTKPLSHLNVLTKLSLVDLRMIHTECDLTYWSEAKCATMSNISLWQKAIKRRSPGMKVLLDTDI